MIVGKPVERPGFATNAFATELAQVAMWERQNA